MMSKPSSTRLEKRPLGMKSTPVKLTGREESASLVAEMSPRRTPQTAKSCRKLGEGPSRWTGHEKSWTTPRRRVGDKDRFSENMQVSGNKTKLKPVSLFTPPRHYREQVWPTPAALSPINLNGTLSCKEDRRQGKEIDTDRGHDITPGEKILLSKGDLVPSLSASGRRVQFGSKLTHLKGKDLFEVDRDSSQVHNQKRVVWNNPTFCAEGPWDKNARNTRPAECDAKGDDYTGLSEIYNGVINEQKYLSLSKLDHTAESSSKSSFVEGYEPASRLASSKTGKTSTVSFGNGLSDREETPEKGTAVAIVEADLEAQIRRDIEEEIENEIRILSEKLAELHARQGVLQTDRDQCPDVALSCPQTPILSVRRARTPDRVHFVQDFVTEAKGSPVQEHSMNDSTTRITEEGGQTAESNTSKQRKSRMVSAKFLNWNRAVGTEGKKLISRKAFISGPSGSSPQVPRRGMSLGGATLISKRREASSHSPYPRGSSRPAAQKGPSDEETQPPSNFQRECPAECKTNVENAGSIAPGLSSNQSSANELGKVLKLLDHSVDESSSRPQTQSPALSAWYSLGMSKRFDWIKTLRSGGEVQCVKQQGLSAAFKGDDQDQNNLNAAAAAAGKVSPVITDKSDPQVPKYAGSRIVASRYGSSPQLGGAVATDKGADVGRNPDSKTRREDSGKKPGVRSGHLTQSSSSPAKALKNDNTKSRARVGGDTSGVAPKLTPRNNSVRVGGQNSSLLQCGVASNRPPFSAGKKAEVSLTQKLKGQNTGHMVGGQGSRQENIASSNLAAKEEIEGNDSQCGSKSPDPTCDLLTRFEQLVIKQVNVGNSPVKSEARGLKSTSATLRGQPSSSTAAVLFSYREPSPAQGADAVKTPSTCPQRRTGSRVHVTPPDQFMTPSDLGAPSDDCTGPSNEEFWTPSVLFSPPPAPGPSSTTKDLLPLVTELRSQLNTSPVLKKYSELLKDLDSLEVERNQLPKIATRSFFGISPRDSGCVKRANERIKGHPFGSQSDPSGLDHLDAKDLEQSLETLAARFSATNFSGDTMPVPGIQGNREDIIQGLLVGCLETYAQEGRWENGALMQQGKKEDFLATYVKGNVALCKSAEFKQHGEVLEVSELENLWLLVEKLDKERRDSVYEMLSRQLAKIQQE